MKTNSPLEIDSRIYALYDEYCHGAMDRREFLAKASAIAVGGMAMAQALFPRYANAQTISFTDPRIKASYVKYASLGGTSGEMRGYLVQPTTPTPIQFPAVLVIHENRGLNPYIEDVARRLAAAGFLALAPDGLFLASLPALGTLAELRAALTEHRMQSLLVLIVAASASAMAWYSAGVGSSLIANSESIATPFTYAPAVQVSLFARSP